jgi:hypothetical protein
MVVDIKFTLNPLISNEFESKVLLLEVDHHRDYLDELVVYALVSFHLLHRLLGCDLFR